MTLPATSPVTETAKKVLDSVIILEKDDRKSSQLISDHGWTVRKRRLIGDGLSGLWRRARLW